jgi:hypothetical protein
VENSGALSQKEFVVGLHLLVNGSFEDQVDCRCSLIRCAAVELCFLLYMWASLACFVYLLHSAKSVLTSGILCFLFRACRCCLPLSLARSLSLYLLLFSSSCFHTHTHTHSLSLSGVCSLFCLLMFDSLLTDFIVRSPHSCVFQFNSTCTTWTVMVFSPRKTFWH